MGLNDSKIKFADFPDNLNYYLKPVHMCHSPPPPSSRISRPGPTTFSLEHPKLGQNPLLLCVFGNKGLGAGV